MAPSPKALVSPALTIGCIGTDHTRTPLGVRERLATSGERLYALLERLKADPLIDEAAVLSTCNRVELYVASSDVRAALGRAVDHLLKLTGLSSPDVALVLQSSTDLEVARHLCGVASGLCSLVVGETQVLTQVREAFEHAAARGAAGRELGTLARMAVACGKRVRAETGLGSADTSVSARAVEIAGRRFGGLEGRSALLLGAGRINAVSARLLSSAGIGSTVVVSRTREAAARLAARCGGYHAPMDDLPALLADADLAIAATRAPRPPIVPSTIRAREPTRPLLLFDIAVPRDVHPSVGALPHVELVDIDGLCAVTPQANSNGVGAAWTIVDQAVERYVLEARIKRAGPLIARLRAQVDQDRDAELAQTLAGLQYLTQQEREAVTRLAHRLTNSLFHHLVMEVKSAAATMDGDSYRALGVAIPWRRAPLHQHFPDSCPRISGGLQRAASRGIH